MTLGEARRCEALEAALNEATAVAFAGPETAVERIAGGVAIYLEPGSPVTQLSGAGLSGVVTAGEMDRLERFFRRRASPVFLPVCPAADASLVAHLRDRGYRISHFEQTLTRSLDGPLPEPRGDLAVEQVTGLVFLHTILRGYGVEPSARLLRTFGAMFSAPHSAGFLARRKGSAAGGAGLFRSGGAALLFCDATLEAHRGAGVQAGLISRRLREAKEAGCELAVASTAPGSVSQRNYERAGFQVAYTKAFFTLA